MFLDNLGEIRDGRMEIISDIISSGRDLWLLGFGYSALHIKKVMEHFHVPVKGCCIHHSVYTEGISFDGLPVERLSNVLAEPEGKAILITVSSHETGMKIKEYIGDAMPVYFCDDWYTFFKMDFSFVSDNAQRYEWLYSRLADDLSKEVFIAYLKSHLTGDFATLCQLYRNREFQYDYELLGVSATDTMVDCGCFEGDTIQDVSEYLSCMPQKVIAFEPDKANRLIINKDFSQSISDGSIELIPYGCGEQNGFSEFSVGCGPNSFFLGTGESQTYLKGMTGDGSKPVQIVKIDDVIGTRPVDWIKMDIEGGELSALKGARQTIIANKPRLAICAYHRLGDLIDIPRFLESLEDDGVYYKYYLRHHGTSFAETVLYALPC